MLIPFLTGAQRVQPSHYAQDQEPQLVIFMKAWLHEVCTHGSGWSRRLKVERGNPCTLSVALSVLSLLKTVAFSGSALGCTLTLCSFVGRFNMRRAFAITADVCYLRIARDFGVRCPAVSTREETASDLPGGDCRVTAYAPFGRPRKNT